MNAIPSLPTTSRVLIVSDVSSTELQSIVQHSHENLNAGIKPLLAILRVSALLHAYHPSANRNLLPGRATPRPSRFKLPTLSLDDLVDKVEPVSVHRENP
jgi:hypothetical protein